MSSYSFALVALTTALLANASTASSQAQGPGDTVLSAYRDYRAAEQRDDLPAAEAAAARALQASETRDGSGGSTAVLAMNLAIVRMDMGHKADALAPARRALDLAHTGAKGVDELAARLTVGEIELTVDPTDDESDLRAALHDAEGRTDLDGFAYSAAVTLARAATSQKHWADAMTAWGEAEHHLQGAPGDHNEALGDVLVGEGAIFVETHKDAEAAERLYKAAELLAPLAPESADGNNVNVAELEYAEARAWIGVLVAREEAEKVRATLSPGPLALPHSLLGQPALCPGTLSPTPLPTFPSGAIDSVGAGMLRIETNDKGDVTKAVLLAATGGDAFRQALMDPQVHWLFKSTEDPPPGCRLASVDRLVAVIFTIAGQQQPAFNPWR